MMHNYMVVKLLGNLEIKLLKVENISLLLPNDKGVLVDAEAEVVYNLPKLQGLYLFNLFVCHFFGQQQ